MKSRYQRRLWRYVTSGRRYKLRRLLKHHREALDLDQFVGPKKRTPLHQSCAQRDRKIAVLLLKYGADPSVLDQRGDTVLHVAARQAVRKGGTVYEDLFVPLRKHCRSNLSIRNRAGKTPGDLLGEMHEKWVSCPPETTEEFLDSNDWWFEELEHEYFDLDDDLDASWQCAEDYFNSYLDPESFEDWADRIAQEYSQKRRGREERHSEQRQSSSKREQRKTSSKEEHLLFQKRARIKAEELKEAKRRRYEESCSQFFSNNSTHLLTYSDIPWPCPSGTPEEMAAVALHGNDCSDAAAYRRFIRRQQVLWHPDKFAQRCGTRLAERDRHRILETVTALSQAFNQLAAVAK